MNACGYIPMDASKVEQREPPSLEASPAPPATPASYNGRLINEIVFNGPGVLQRFIAANNNEMVAGPIRAADIQRARDDARAADPEAFDAWQAATTTQPERRPR